MATQLSELETPALVVDVAKMSANIARMQNRVDKLGVKLRPHLKTTKSLAIAERVCGKEAGITVSISSPM